MKRWRDSITPTIALTVVVAVLLGFSLQRLVSSGLLYLGLAPQQTLQTGNVQLFQQLPGRIAGLLDVLNGTPDAERSAVIAAAQRPPIRIRLLDGPMPNLVNRGELNADLLRRRIEAVLTVPRPVVVVNSYAPASPQAGTSDGRVQNGMPFYRIEGSRNPDTGGVGLGLSVTRSIVWEHGGDISLATRKGGGLSVRMKLPAGPGPSSPVQEKIRSSGQAPVSDLGGTNA